MVSSTRWTIAVILIIFSAALFARAQSVQPKEPTTTITGKVTIKGKGAPGIFIGLRRQDNPYTRDLTGFKATTDSEGKYRIENVTAGSYIVTPIAPAYVSEEIGTERTLNVTKGETIEGIDFVLVLGGAITGKVLDPGGHPLIEEDVFIVPETESARTNMNNVRVRTDDRGIYRFFGLARGRYRVGAGTNNLSFGNQRAGYMQTYHPGVPDRAQATVIEVSEGSEVNNVDITLTAALTTYTASGRIVDGQTGEPVSNATYSWTRYFGENGSATTGSNVVSNSRGEFRLEGLAPGKYSVSAAERNGTWRADELQFEIVDQDVTGLVIRTEQAGAISGVIVLEGTDDKKAREELRNTNLYAAVPSAPGTRGRASYATQGPDGRFRISGLGAGTATFFIPSAGQLKIARVERNGMIQPRGIEIRPGEQVGGVQVFVHYANASIRGSVVVENGPMPPGGRVYIWMRKLNEDPNTQYSGTRTSLQLDARNQFVSEHLLPGTYELFAGISFPQERRSIAGKRQEVVVTAGTTTNVSITLDLHPPAPKP